MARGGARAGDMQRSTARLDNARGCLAIDGNGSYLLLPIDHHTQSAWTRIRLGTQRARWAKTFTAGTFPSGVTLKGVAVPGALGREQDATDDLRKARCYYSLDGGSTRTEFAPGQMNLAVAVASGATLTLDVDINTEAKPTQIPPWVGGAAGEGVSLVYDDPAATVYVDRPVSGISGSAAAVGSVTGAAVIIT